MILSVMSDCNNQGLSLFQTVRRESALDIMTFFNRNVRSGVYHNIQTSDKIGYTNVTPPMFLTVHYWDEQRDVMTVEIYLTNSNHTYVNIVYSSIGRYGCSFKPGFPFVKGVWCIVQEKIRKITCRKSLSNSWAAWQAKKKRHTWQAHE